MGSKISYKYFLARICSISSLLTARGGALSTEYSPSRARSSSMYINNVTCDPRMTRRRPYLPVSPEDHFLFSSRARFALGSIELTASIQTTWYNLNINIPYTPSLVVPRPLLVGAAIARPPGAATAISLFLCWVFFLFGVLLPVNGWVSP